MSVYLQYNVIVQTLENFVNLTKKEKNIRKTWHVNGGEKVKNGYVIIIYFSLINQNYIL